MASKYFSAVQDVNDNHAQKSVYMTGRFPVAFFFFFAFTGTHVLRDPSIGWQTVGWDAVVSAFEYTPPESREACSVRSVLFSGTGVLGECAWHTHVKASSELLKGRKDGVPFCGFQDRCLLFEFWLFNLTECILESTTSHRWKLSS